MFIENCDILVTSYETNESHPRARIYFEGNTSNQPQIGQIELGGNVNLCFRNVDLVTNDCLTTPEIGSTINLSLFGLRSTRSKVTFEGFRNSYTPFESEINLAKYYSLFQGNGFLFISLIEAFFINCVIISDVGGLSPDRGGIVSLGVICSALRSTRGINGWQDAQIVLNNF
jgi:hypothetical protein